MPLFYALLLAHLISDFLQPTVLIRWTKQSVAGLLAHTAIYGFLTAVVLAGYDGNWWLWLSILIVSHFILDHFKYLLGGRFSLWGLYVFVTDQILHIGIMALVVFGGNLAKGEPGPFLALISDYWKVLPFIVAYIAGTFGAAILVFEAGRTLRSHSDRSGDNCLGNSGNAVVSLRHRLPGMIERAFAISFILGGLYYLVPVSFVISVYGFYASRKTSAVKRLMVELTTSVLSATIIGLALLFL